MSQPPTQQVRPADGPVVVRRAPVGQPPAGQPADRLACLEDRVQALEEGEGRPRGDRCLDDVRWTCPKCGHFLGLWDNASSTLRIQRRDVYLWVTLPGGAGVAGHVEFACRGCGQRARWPA